MRVLLQLRSSLAAHAAALSNATAPAVTAGIGAIAPGFSLDPAYPIVQLPGVQPASRGHFFSLHQPLTFSLTPAASTYLVRGTIPDGGAQLSTLASLTAHPDVVGVFSDPVIESCLTCPDSPAVGREADVARLLDVAALRAQGMDGTNVAVAVIDTGVNLGYLQSHGRQPNLVVAQSWTPQGVETTPGQHPVHHGTMCAFDVGIAAAQAQLLDDAVLLSTTPGATPMAGLLSDAVLGYSQLLRIINAMPTETRALVVTNSWGMFSPSWDFPPSHPGNYSDNPSHPFNIIVATLENAGADILFAAGNCGRDCPDGRCNFGDTQPICGANSHPSVISVAGVDTTKARVGYSSQGPGRLTAQKPDIASFTHFTGSDVFHGPDTGTSAACPVAAGVIAAIRTKYPSSVLSPAQLRALLCKTAESHGAPGFNYDYGWGVVNVTGMLEALTQAAA